MLLSTLAARAPHPSWGGRGEKLTRWEGQNSVKEKRQNDLRVMTGCFKKKLNERLG